QRFEERFYGNLNARETAEYQTLSAHVNRKNTEIQNELKPWEASIISLTVPNMATYIGRKLEELAWREKYGINIVYIKRGEKLIHAPVKTNILLPLDVVGIIATDEQMKAFKPVFDLEERITDSEPSLDTVVLDKIIVNEYTKLKGLDIRSSGLREKTNGLVIGIERQNTRILNPESTTVFEWDDLIWIVGNKEKIAEFKKTGGH